MTLGLHSCQSKEENVMTGEGFAIKSVLSGRIFYV